MYTMFFETNTRFAQKQMQLASCHLRLSFETQWKSDQAYNPQTIDATQQVA